MPLAKIAVLIVELTPSPLKGEAGWWGVGGGEVERVPCGFECLREVPSEVQRTGDLDSCVPQMFSLVLRPRVTRSFHFPLIFSGALLPCRAFNAILSHFALTFTLTRNQFTVTN